MKKAKVNTGHVFERNEKKFMISPGIFARLMQLLDPYMQQDHYGLHTICTIYYDTEDYSLIRKSLDKPAYKEKLRLRSYGVPGDRDTVYLELKKKLKGVTYKRRIPLSLQSARNYLNQGLPPPEERGQIFQEIDWFVQQTSLSGKVLLCYDRIALFGREDPDFRITFDADIRWRNHTLDLGKGDYGSPLLPHGTRLMEIKTAGALPLWLCAILSELEIYPCSFSKYGRVYTDFLMHGTKEAWRHVG